MCPSPELAEPRETGTGVDDELLVSTTSIDCVFSITTGDQRVREVRVSALTLSVGRRPGSTLYLEEASVAEDHAFLERGPDAWTVTDLGSVTGTRLESTPLLPNVPEPWEPGSSLFVGPYQIRWRFAASPEPDPEPPEPEPDPSPDAPLSATFSPLGVTVEAGGQAEAAIELLNQGHSVDHFALRVGGIPPQWVTIPQKQIQLMPDDKQRVPVLFHPPRDSTARAGPHPITLYARSSATGAERAVSHAVLSIAPFVGFVAEAHPTQLENGGTVQVAIENTGNSAAVFAVTGQDAQEAIRFRSERSQVRLEAGQGTELALHLSPVRRSWYRDNQFYPFQIKVMSEQLEPAVQTGQLTVLPLIPSWLRPYLKALLVILIAAIALFVALHDVDGDNIPALIELLTGSRGTSPDGDGDGLLDGLEVRFETDPRDPDTDHDGLNDWQELYQYQTSPLLVDSDCDRIPDGEEVSVHATDPRNAFTSGGPQTDWEEKNPFPPPPAPYACATPTPLPPTPPAE